MATPPGPASPGNPISFDDLRAEPYITPNTDIGLELMGTYKFDDGYTIKKFNKEQEGYTHIFFVCVSRFFTSFNDTIV